MRHHLGALVALAGLCPVLATAAPLPKNPPKGMPHFVLQLKSVDGIKKTYDQVHGKLKDVIDHPVPSGDEIENIASMFFPDWRKAIDAAKPWGGYLTIEPELQKSRPVVLLPFKDEKVFVDFAGKLFENVAEDKDKGYYTAQFQFIFSKIPTFFRFTNGYAFITFEDPSVIENPKTLPDPNDLMLKDETALAALRFYIEGVPDAVKKLARETLAKIDDAVEHVGLTEMILMSMVGAQNAKDFSGRLKQVVDEGKWAALRLDFDTTKLEMALEFDLVPIKESPLGKEIAAYSPHKNRLAGLLDADTIAGLTYSVGNFGNLQIPPEILQVGLKDILHDNNLDGEDEAINKLAKAMVESFKVKEADLGVALKQTPGAKTFTIVAGARLHQTPKLGLAMTAYFLGLPKEKRANFTPSIMKLEGDVAVHKLTLAAFGGETKKLSGSSDLLFCLKDDMFYAALGADAPDRLKECLKLTPKDGPQVQIDVNPARLQPLINELASKEQAELWAKMFPKSERARIFRAKVDGGGTLRVRYTSEIVPILKMIGSKIR